jgi:hypothetical protein
MMFIVIEFNQAGGPASTPFAAYLHHTRDDAVTEKQSLEKVAADAGRGDVYRIATVTIEDENDD